MGNTRLVYGAKQLVRQVTDERPNASHLWGTPDGLEVVRTIRWDKRTSKWLAPLLEAIGDPRIEQLHLTDAGYLYVTFVPTHRADSNDKFPLEEAKAVLREKEARRSEEG